MTEPLDADVHECQVRVLGARRLPNTLNTLNISIAGTSATKYSLAVPGL